MSVILLGLGRYVEEIVEVVSAGAEDMSILIWNPGGSQAELSGNGTRIAAGWLAEHTGARRITVRVAEREVRRAFGFGEREAGG